MMLKVTNIQVTFSELPDEVSLCLNISNCPFRCKGCHSTYLWQDVGIELNEVTLRGFIENNPGITAVCFMGGDADYEGVKKLAKFVKTEFKLKTGWYSGGDLIPLELDYRDFDYIKIGHYDEKLGGLSKRTTNQKMFQVEDAEVLEDITYKFWK